MRPKSFTRRFGGRVSTSVLAAALVLGGTSGVIAAGPAAAQGTGLYISEYVEGTGNNKAIELFNPGAEAIDLSGYRVAVYANGQTTANSYTLSGELAPGETFLFGSSRASFAEQLDASTGAGLWNGDDAVVLYRGEEVVDSLGRVGEQPAGGAWGTGEASTKDSTLRRTGGVPDTIIDDAFDPATAGWKGFGVDVFDDLGVAPGEEPGGPTDPEDPEDPEDPTDPEEPEEPGDPADCEAPAEKIGAVQGEGATSPREGDTVTVQGVVTASFQQPGGYNGYFVQDAGDGSDATSDGIFVYAQGKDERAEGDVVRVTGKVGEHYEMTQITQSGDATVCDTGAEKPAPAELSLPMDDEAREAVEGMSVVLGEGVINESFNYDRYGELTLGSERHAQPTNLHRPGSDEAKALAASNLADSITLDDGINSQNPNPIRHPNGEDYSPENRFRMGDTLREVTGVMHYSFDKWRIQPTAGAEYEETNPRTPAPEVPGSLTVASANVLNYFTTLADEDPNARGANNAAEFERQKAKIVSQLAEIDADVFGLMEIENNSDKAVNDLVDGLNAKIGSEEYAAVETGTLGTDAITTALIYKPAKVERVGEFSALTESVDPNFDTSRHRPALAQVFKDKATGEEFSVVVNHLKSKGSACGAGDPEDPNGQGNCNRTRVEGAKALANWINTDENLSRSGRTLVIGDLNSYAKEDPIVALEDAGFENMVAKFGGPGAYSYVFDGQTGYLDHALATAKLAGEIEGVADWHNNSDEPDINDYNLDFGRSPAYFEDNPYRASDHDPVIVGFTPGGNGAPGDGGDDSDDGGEPQPSGPLGSLGSIGSDSLALLGRFGSAN